MVGPRQWAAVRTYLELMRVPPHWVLLPEVVLNSSSATHGY